MNMNDYRRAMDRVTPDPELKERIMNQKMKKRIPVRRVVSGLLAAALALACLFTAALAASPELRTAVLSFFRMEEHEQVPSGGQGGSQAGPDISQADIGQLVTAQYIRLNDRRYGYSGGMLNDLTWSEDHRKLLDAMFWEVRDNELIPVDISLNTTKVDITFKGNTYRGEFYWFVRDGRLAAFQGVPFGIDTRPEDQWYVNEIPGRTDTVLLRLYQGRQLDYSEYPILYHLDTGEVEDILADIEIETPGLAYSYEWSEDYRRALILYSSPSEVEDPQERLCDLELGTLTQVEDLAGVEAQYANFIDNDTLVLTAYTTDQEGIWQDVTCWTYDIPSGKTVKTTDPLPCYHWWEEVPHGVTISGKNCYYVSETGQVEVIDLKTGARIPIEGFTYQKGDNFLPSPSGNKLLYYSQDPNAEGMGITQIGVIDLEKYTFIAFERDGYENLHEGAIGWEDDNTVGIDAHTPDYETRYLLLYQF